MPYGARINFSLLLILLDNSSLYALFRIVDLTVKTLGRVHQSSRQPRAGPCSQANRRRALLWRQVLASWASLLCCDAVTSLSLHPASDLGLVTSICELCHYYCLLSLIELCIMHAQYLALVNFNLILKFPPTSNSPCSQPRIPGDLLPDMTRLRSLHIQPWSCVKHNLLHSREARRLKQRKRI